MRSSVIALVGVSLFAFGCGGDPSTNLNPTTDPCAYEVKISKELNCPGFTSEADLLATCRAQQLALGTTCQTQNDAMTKCALAQPASSWECDSDANGEADLKTGFCAAETAAYIACLFSGQ